MPDSSDVLPLPYLSNMSDMSDDFGDANLYFSLSHWGVVQSSFQLVFLSNYISDDFRGVVHPHPQPAVDCLPRSQVLSHHPHHCYQDNHYHYYQ